MKVGRPSILRTDEGVYVLDPHEKTLVFGTGVSDRTPVYWRMDLSDVDVVPGFDVHRYRVASDWALNLGMRDHIGLTPEDLRARLDGLDLPEIGTFDSRPHAIESVSEALHARRDEIHDRFASVPRPLPGSATPSTKGPLELVVPIHEETGLVLRRGDGEVVPGNAVRLVLAPKAPDLRGGTYDFPYSGPNESRFRIDKAHPTVVDDTHPHETRVGTDLDKPTPALRTPEPGPRPQPDPQPLPSRAQPGVGQHPVTSSPVFRADPSRETDMAPDLGIRPPPRILLSPPRRGVPLSKARPEVYVPPSTKDVARLAEAVAKHGADRPHRWIRAINPEYRRNPNGPFGANSVDSSIAYVSTRQTGIPTAAAGYMGVGVPNVPDTTVQLYDWAGVQPENFVAAQTLADIPQFQYYAWYRVSEQLAGKPPGTVALVTVRWAPNNVNGVYVGGWTHTFVAEETPKGLHWADPHVGSYRPWPPRYGWPISSIESIFRISAGQPWRTR
jgi:hypothetical protein